MPWQRYFVFAIGFTFVSLCMAHAFQKAAWRVPNSSMSIDVDRYFYSHSRFSKVFCILFLFVRLSEGWLHPREVQHTFLQVLHILAFWISLVSATVLRDITMVQQFVVVYRMHIMCHVVWCYVMLGDAQWCDVIILWLMQPIMCECQSVSIICVCVVIIHWRTLAYTSLLLTFTATPGWCECFESLAFWAASPWFRWLGFPWEWVEGFLLEIKGRVCVFETKTLEDKGSLSIFMVKLKLGVTQISLSRSPSLLGCKMP